MKDCNMKTTTKGFTLIELMIVVAILGVLAAVTIPIFVNYMKRSKTAEATINIKAIIEGVVSYYSTRRSMMPPNIDWTPADPAPGPQPYPINDEDWNDDTSWPAIGWRPLKNFYYQYKFSHQCGDAPCTVAGETAKAEAQGDLDGDGTLSNFSRILERTASGMQVIKDIEVVNELE